MQIRKNAGAQVFPETYKYIHNHDQTEFQYVRPGELEGPRLFKNDDLRLLQGPTTVNAQRFLLEAAASKDSDGVKRTANSPSLTNAFYYYPTGVFSVRYPGQQ